MAEDVIISTMPHLTNIILGKTTNSRAALTTTMKIHFQLHLLVGHRLHPAWLVSLVDPLHHLPAMDLTVEDKHHCPIMLNPLMVVMAAHRDMVIQMIVVEVV